MKTLDEDSPLSMLATAWVNMATVIPHFHNDLNSYTYFMQGGAKIQEAAYIYEELIDKYNGSALLLNGLAAAKMSLGQFDEAETTLQEALTKVFSKFISSSFFYIFCLLICFIVESI